MWPLAFLWRHHIELSLKDIIAAGREIPGEPDGFPNGHWLLQLWQTAKPYIQLCGGPDLPELAYVEAIIAEFESIDPGGDDSATLLA